MAQPPLHILFSPSAAGQLRAALKVLGRPDQVIAQFDDLSFGPIDPPDSVAREDWVGETLGWEWDGMASGDEAFWAEALANRPGRVVWVSRRSAAEFSGFLHFIFSLGDGPCEVVDLSEVTFTPHNARGERTTPRLVEALGMWDFDQIIENDLLSLAEPLGAELRLRYRGVWERLRKENAALRVVTPDLELTSAPISYFDERLLSHVRPDGWQPAARVVGYELASFLDDHLHQAGDMFLAGRLRALADEGRIEAKGELPELQGSQVRLPVG